ncbi:MAG: isoprenyl transferase [Monoglobaceae bacterium]
MFFKRKPKQQNNETMDMARIPKHIGIIMDGNGRWAKSKGLPRKAGHRQGAKTIENITDYCASIGVEVITAYAFSTENWNRPKEEVDALMDLLYEYLIQVEEKFKNDRTKFMVSGDVSRFSPKLQEAIAHAIDVTKDGDRIIINLALNYGGRDEIVRASKKLYGDICENKLSVDDVNEEVFSRYLDTYGLPEVDLIIRPSGEQRLSNFLLWQAAYAEFWYSDICWPDFSSADMDAAIIAYQKRDRRYGGV